MRFALKRGPETLAVRLSGEEVLVVVRRSGRARRLILRLDRASGMPLLTLPHRTSLGEGERFLRRHATWLERRLADRPAASPFRDGAIFPLRGRPCRIVHVGGRGVAEVRDGADGLELRVTGAASHLSRRVTDALRREARRDFSAAVEICAAAIGKTAPRIRIGDTASRWGSCSSRGGLAFSWRLIFAEPAILRYLAAHEVAHLVEMNHGPAFWALVAELDPDFRRHRAWLKRHGAELHAYGRP